MNNDNYVILIDGYPYRKNNAIRTYKTRERAVKEAQVLVDYGKYGYPSWVDAKIETAQFGVINSEEVVAV
ncbi:hypothetical protein [Cohnella silvisoli]|uniref:Uncharacterized protein n=1 Tax=Cohnella silvisoli TaxID=2873699 RepID=A0ABV1KYV8_9BACL|nr:hypothetical protein [Cohnella silvisoli]MCD9024348.1 hypothetical protein [Cohnella silvisoli]